LLVAFFCDTCWLTSVRRKGRAVTPLTAEARIGVHALPEAAGRAWTPLRARKRC
jgi:hypothetical protein